MQQWSVRLLQWLAARKHAVAEQKASLRKDHLISMLVEETMPVEFLGSERLHRCYATNNGALTVAMMEILGKNARVTANQVVKELAALEESEGKKAKYYLDITEQIYVHEEDDSFATSKEGLTRVLNYFKKSESARLVTLADKERARQPETEAEMTDLVCQPEQRAPRDSSRGRKRARNSKNNSRNNTPNPTTRPAEPTTASTSTSLQCVGDDAGTSYQQPRAPRPPKPQQPRQGQQQQQQQYRPRSARPNNNNYNNRGQGQQGPRHPGPRQQTPRPQQNQRPQQQQNDVRQLASNGQNMSGNQAPQVFSQSTQNLLSALSVLKDFMN